MAICVYCAHRYEGSGRPEGHGVCPLCFPAAMALTTDEDLHEAISAWLDDSSQDTARLALFAAALNRAGVAFFIGRHGVHVLAEYAWQVTGRVEWREAHLAPAPTLNLTVRGTDVCWGKTKIAALRTILERLAKEA